jgi:hypothetical protein
MKLKPEDFNFSYTQWSHLIDEYIFSERDRAMLKRRLLDGIPFEQLAEEFCLSTQQTKAIIYKGQTRLFQYL